MSYIFISHSSKDNDKAKETSDWLIEQGFSSLFLDFDPELGIPAGCNWEQELYYKLRKCRAVIFLCSEHSAASDWCFAEIALSRALGKSIFPVKIKPCKVKPFLTDIQAIDLTINPKEGYERLWKGLVKSGLDPKDFFQYDPKRPPYPGLLAFQEEDAAVFFGRDDCIRDALDKLNNISRYGGRRIVMLLGASGSGKSSLVRAGLVPRLKRDPDTWLVVNPFRPRQHPLDELAIALSETFDRYGQSRNRMDISEHLRNSAGSVPPDIGVLLELVRELTVSANKRDAVVVLVIDQFEELLSLATNSEATHFLFLLREVLSKEDNGLIVLGTLRSDFLHEFQNHSALCGMPFEEVMVGPLTVDGYVKVIEGPAEVAGLKLEPGLTELMIKDTETEDALPLLAFTLRELWELYGYQDGDLTIEEYRDKLGGLLGSVQRAADGVISAYSLSEQQKRDLHRAFLSMTQINEKGQYARRAAHWNDLPPISHEILRRFVEARLLVSGKEDNTLEVAHEALLRKWPLLKGWLDEDREFLLWRQRLHSALSEFKYSGLLCLTNRSRTLDGKLQC